MKRLIILAATSSLCIAAAGPCTGPVNSASAAHACSVASSAGAAVDAIARDLAAAGFAQEKIDALLPLIAQGRMVVTIGCQVVLPAVSD